MPSLAATTTPQAVTGLSTETLYVAQNKGLELVRLATAAAAPLATSGEAWDLVGRTDERIDSATVKVPSGENLYAWTLRGTSTVYLDEAPG